MKLPKIKNSKLLDEALTHRSYLNEAKDRKNSNERLEFLGDSVLSLIVSSHLFSQYSELNEGKLTNLRSQLVNTKILAEIAKDYDLGSILYLSKGEEESGGRNNQSILADAFEAYLGALFIDQGIEEVTKFINSAVIPKADEFIKNNLLKDPKSLLQELIQAQKQGSPIYKVLGEEGPAHSKKFLIGVFVGDKLLGEGEGKSKQEAEEKAAEKAMGGFNS